MLHITNGESAAIGIGQSGVPGSIMAWNDVLHEGPVPADLPLHELTAVRARFLADAGWASYDDALRDLRARDAALEGSLDEDEIVLWFEHDLYDQLHLLQILDWLGAQRVTPHITLVCRDEYLGPLPPDRLAERFRERVPVTADQTALARGAWCAFRSDDPRGLLDRVAADTSALPYLRPALLRQLQQFPSTLNGLSRSEQQALESVRSGARTLAEAFVASHHRREDAIFLGDIVFARYMKELSDGADPIVTLTGGDFHTCRIALTDMGHAVLDGRRDRVRTGGLDRWYGGVHLSGREARWRWNGTSLE